MKKKVKLNNVEVELTKEQLEDALKEFNEPEYDYPICCKNKRNGTIVLFTGETIDTGTCLREDEEIFIKEGETSDGLIPHTDEETWEQIPYDKELGLYHKQPVYAWDKYHTHVTVFGFYNAISKCLHGGSGESCGPKWEIYSSEIPEHMKEFKEI